MTNDKKNEGAICKVESKPGTFHNFKFKMSRLSRTHIWYQWFGTSETAMCPICGVNQMTRDDTSSEKWHREHIVRLGMGGPDTFPNLIPTCKSCNLAQGKANRSTFDYMVRIGRMTAEQGKCELERHLHQCSAFDPQCEAVLKSSETRCTNLKGGKDELFCWKHIRAIVLEPMDCSE